MRFTNLIIIHCSATRCDRSYTEHDLITDHLSQGFFGAGYHYYICKNGDIKMLRPLEHSEERAAAITLTA
ncbi:N-acetylmuramoyl-L-alanine amidase [Bacteroides stercoris]|uniref:N-acetylmuramoyl-L-alanine amidase n=1 Tax=Bacteroides stercoris TaxID=46506 RepID=A0A3E4URE4_BACSE|nr:N-acetylmuramoyl-L-alanine amidase [Bacteroides stercoris]RGR28047.1 N-acetylmuramoyl-L-alanine amidase [Bacteroides stercoris]RGR36294.1 N-acetylmuramoyl-L-alanine amidase [Bacteroides stercoris]